MTNEILALIYKRDYTLRMAVRLSFSDKMNEYKKLRNLVISTIRNSQRSYYHDYKRTITANKSCDVWKAVNQSLGKNRKISITSDLSPDAWNDHFASVGNKLCSKFSENDELIWRNNSSIYNFKFKSLLKEDVLAFMNRLPSETNVDILGYDSCILKRSSEIICSSLTITANKSCDVWKAVNQSLGKNRKISITSDLSPDAWNDHFASVGNKLCSKFSENDELIWRNNSSIYNFKFKSLLKEDVLAFINRLPSETNVDILGYDSCILKRSSEIICSSLTILFIMSLSNGEIPNE